MLKGTFPVEKFKQLSTPFYYYDVKLLQDTLDVVKTESGKYGYHVHYAVKANANPRILSIIAANGLGADCVSGGEVQAALDAGFPAWTMIFSALTWNPPLSWKSSMSWRPPSIKWPLSPFVSIRKWMPIRMPRSRRV